MITIATACVNVLDMQTLADLNANRIPNVQNWRNQYKADLVQVIINNGEYCGFGNVMVSSTAAQQQLCLKCAVLVHYCINAQGQC
jgi:hypothetical protein